MYQKPVVERLGEFRDLTRAGGEAFGGDGFSIWSAATSAPPSPTTSAPTTSPGSVSISRS